MTREEALEFLRQNTLTNMRLALLEDRPDLDIIRALIDTVEGGRTNKHFDWPVGVGVREDGSMTQFVELVALDFNLCLDASSVQGYAGDYVRVFCWSYLPCEIELTERAR